MNVEFSREEGVSYDDGDEWDDRDWDIGLGGFLLLLCLALFWGREREERALLHYFGVRMAIGLLTFFFPSDTVSSVFFFFGGKKGARNCMIGCIVCPGFSDFIILECFFFRTKLSFLGRIHLIYTLLLGANFE